MSSFGSLKGFLSGHTLVDTGTGLEKSVLDIINCDCSGGGTSLSPTIIIDNTSQDMDGSQFALEVGRVSSLQPPTGIEIYKYMVREFPVGFAGSAAPGQITRIPFSDGHFFMYSGFGASGISVNPPYSYAYGVYWIGNNGTVEVIDLSAPPVPPSSPVNKLFAGNNVGDTIYVVNGRKEGESAGLGTGIPAYWSGTEWLTFYDNTIVQE